MLDKALRGCTRDFRTLVSLNFSEGNEEFIKQLIEKVKEDGRFSLHHATSLGDRVANLGMLVSYASHIKADMIVRINCHEPVSDAQEGLAEARKPVVKVRSHEVRELSSLCGERASIIAFPGDEEAEVIIVLREIQKRVADSISIDSVLTSLRDANVGKAELNEKLRELRGDMRKRTFFVSIDVFPINVQGVEKEVGRCSELVGMLHEHYSRKNALFLDSARLVLR
ncbi:hypothetical protein H0N99_05625 [Candidatus Micrarchaeota archaeon]|nr:hypothetical protein [Candidatus Micrarchaeota archaeon]